MNYHQLINKDHPIFAHEIADDELMIMKAIDGMDILINRTAYQHFLKLQSYLENKFHIEIGIDSAYRSILRQEELKQEFARQYGKEYAQKMVAPSKTSEHHTGLAIDLSLKDGSWIMENEELMNKEQEWEIVHNSLAPFGFILRYPKGKEDVTKYSYEPWHIRYVGKKAAIEMSKKHWTLEEYDQNKRNKQKNN